ncbi:MAG: AraC family transcriptional regulator [Desulfofustis sp.]|jgi:AraC-like DNA-binding protein|nr:AraC family transcriptional regulator [Desulfofustis sp.]
MHHETFFKDPRLPFVECRYSQNSRSLFKEHMHNSVSIGAVDQGQVHYSIENHTITLGPGALALINPETLHCCNAVHTAERSYFMMHLDIDWCLTVQRSLWKVESFVPFATIRLDDSSLYNQYCLVMERLLAADVHQQEKEQLLVEMVCHVFIKGCRPQKEQEQISADIDILKHLLKEDLHKDLTLNSLAQSLNANPYTLLRKFKAQTGISPHAYRMNCRIDLAKKHLREGRDITDTALVCGFFDQSHFHRHFKAMTAATPQEYRVNFMQ